MSEDAHFSGDEPLFAQDNQRGPGYAIYTCPRCGSSSDAKLLQALHAVYLACDRCGLPVDEHPSFIRGVQRSSFPSSSVNLHITGVRTNGYDIPMSQVHFREAMTGKREFHQPIPTAAEHSWLKGMQITWEGDKRAKASA